MLPNVMPKIQAKDKNMVDALFNVANNKIKEIEILKYLLQHSSNEEETKLIKALLHSNKVMLEDLMRESEFMFPEVPKSKELLIRLANSNEVGVVAKELLDKINFI